MGQMYSSCASCCESFWTAVEKGNFARWVIRLRYIHIHTTHYALYGVFLDGHGVGGLHVHGIWWLLYVILCNAVWYTIRPPIQYYML